MTLSRQGALAAHARDELGLDAARMARPFQAAWTSALSFATGAALPLVAVAVAPASARAGVTVAVTLIALGLLGDLGARLGGAPRRRADDPGRGLGGRRDGDHRRHRRARRHGRLRPCGASRVTVRATS